MRSLALMLVLLSPALAQAQLRIDPPTLDLGEIRGGAPALATFRLINTGSEPIELVDLERSCGCLAPQWSDRTIPPGKQAALTLRMRTLGQAEGPRSWPLTLVTRTPGADAKHRLDIKATIRNEIVLQPPQVALFVTQTLDHEITLIDHRSTPLAVTSWDAKMPGVRIEKIDAKPGTTRLKLSVDGAQLPAGRHDHVLHLYTNDLAYAHLEVPVALVRVEKKRITWSPETPELIVAPGQTKASVLLQIRGLDEPVTTIAGDDGLACQWRTDDGQTFLRVTLDRTQFTGRGVQSAVRIRAGNETTAIPLIIRVE